MEGEFGLGKPEAAVFRHVAGALGAPPSRCLMAGDDFRRDVLGALEVGMQAVWIDVEGCGEPPAPTPRPHGRVASLAELAAGFAGRPSG